MEVEGSKNKMTPRKHGPPVSGEERPFVLKPYPRLPSITPPKVWHLVLKLPQAQDARWITAKKKLGFGIYHVQTEPQGPPMIVDVVPQTRTASQYIEFSKDALRSAPPHGQLHQFQIHGLAVQYKNMAIDKTVTSVRPELAAESFATWVESAFKTSKLGIPHLVFDNGEALP